MTAPADQDPNGRALKDAIEREAAAAEILEIIASSPTDTQPVFDAIVRSGLNLFSDAAISITLPDGDRVRAAAVADSDAARSAAWRKRWPTPFTRDYLHAIAILDRKVVDLPDVANAPGWPMPGKQNFLATGYKAITIVPMMRGDAAIGALSVVRRAPGPLSDEQLALLKTFAAQAVIAIENTRLVNELRQRTDDLSESLEQQTATSEVLRVISSSPGDLDAVFTAVLSNVTRICGAKFALLWLAEDDRLRSVAFHNVPAAYAEARCRQPAVTAGPGTVIGRVQRTKRLVQVEDITAEQAYQDRDPLRMDTADLGGARTLLGVPLLKDDEFIGVIAVYRQEARLFTEKQTELATNFAAQAVIAIENTRLLTELRQRTDDLSESLEQQTATSEVLRVISSSPGELEPVFEAILESALRLCEARFGTLFRYDGEVFHADALIGVPPPFEAELRRGPRRPTPDSALGRMTLTKQTVHIHDVRAERAYREGDPLRRATADLGGARTFVAVPMLKNEDLVGALIIYRQEVRAFSDKQIELVQSFAAQAVIAIENTRLINEVRQQASQLEAQSQELRTLNQQLEQRVDEQVGEIERMGRLRRFLSPQVADLIVSSGSEKQLESHRREITALFCDLRGFTGFSETSDPEDVMALLREYHKAIGEIIFRHGGTLERFAGDGVMVIFGDPVPLPNPTLAAVQMALEMRAAIGGLIEKWRRLGHELGFGIGISHGYATLGTIGFEGRFDYAAIGTVSNVASRLCDEAQPGQILISPRVLLAVEEAVSVEPVAEMVLKGIRRPILVHNVTGAAAVKAAVQGLAP